MKLAGKRILTTGSSQGIGREIAILLATEKPTLIITYKKEKNKAETTAEECKALGAQVEIFKLDMSDDESIEKVVKSIGSVDILINNAGTAVMSPFHETDAADIEPQLRTNVEGLMKLTRLCINKNLSMVVNIASGAGKTAYPNMAVYCATKAAVRFFTMALGKENKIKAYCVNPGLTATKLTNYQGIDPVKVAQVVLKTVKEEYGLLNGGEVDVWEKV